MIILALEFSTAIQSAALLQNDHLLAETHQPARRNDQGRMIASLETLRQSVSLEWADVDLFAVGLGPGAYTALRMALATAHGFAVPGSRPVFGLASTDAAAEQVGEQIDRSHILLCGDARRNLLWCASYERTPDGWKHNGDFQLVDPSRLDRQIHENTLVATSDWPTLEPLLRAAVQNRGALREEPVHPQAATLGRLALKKKNQGIPSLPLTPLYLHPPVLIPPTWSPPPHE